jgi:chemotaxis protein CheC
VRAGTGLTEVECDALRELANVGAGHAATSLSGLLSGERLAFQPPEVWTETALQLAERLGKAPWVAAVLGVHGDIRGALWLVFGRAEAESLAARLSAGAVTSGVEQALTRLAGEAGLSALSGMRRLTGLVLEAREPALLHSVAEALAESPATDEEVLVLGVRLHGQGFSVAFLFLPARAALGTLLRSLRV